VILCDVNVLLYAFRRDTDRHDEYRDWLKERLAGPANFGVSDLVLSGVIRVATHPRVFVKPSTLKQTVAFVEAVRSSPVSVTVSPGHRHWDVFRDLCVKSRVKGNLVADAYHAALAIESGCEWITTDRDFARFTDLRWRHPFD